MGGGELRMPLGQRLAHVAPKRRKFLRAVVARLLGRKPRARPKEGPRLPSTTRNWFPQSARGALHDRPVYVAGLERAPCSQ
jgi:hypothetical protein